MRYYLDGECWSIGQDLYYHELCTVEGDVRDYIGRFHYDMQNLDLKEETRNLILQDILSDKSFSDILMFISGEEYYLVLYALKQALIPICPFSGQIADRCTSWTPEEMYCFTSFGDLYFYYENAKDWETEDLQAFTACVYLQTAEDPNTDWLVDQDRIWQRSTEAWFLEEEYSNDHVYGRCVEMPKIDPDYYKWHPIECKEVTNYFNFNLGCAIKYIWRSGGPVTKGSEIEDLKKAIRYLEFEIERLEK